MESVILGMFAETSIHPGTGRGVGVVDLPVAREAATDYPVIVGSSLKGALKDKAGANVGAEDSSIDRTFGSQDQAGNLLVSDARLLLLPVRSLTGAYRWATCLHLMERYGRDLKRAGLPADWLPAIKDIAVERGSALTNSVNDMFLEERQFSIMPNSSDAIEKLADAVGLLIPDELARERLADQLAILNDDDFAWFARYGLAIQARNVLEDDTKRSTNLWYEETLPPDTLMYALIAGRDRKDGADSAVTTLQNIFEDSAYLQTGGNETVGQGWFAVKVCSPDEEGAK